MSQKVLDEASHFTNEMWEYVVKRIQIKGYRTMANENQTPNVDETEVPNGGQSPEVDEVPEVDMDEDKLADFDADDDEAEKSEK
jgi:hypothetical protein